MRCSTTDINPLITWKGPSQNCKITLWFYFAFPISPSSFFFFFFLRTSPPHVPSCLSCPSSFLFFFFWHTSPPHMPSCLCCPPLFSFFWGVPAVCMCPLIFAALLSSLLLLPLPVLYDTAAAVATVCAPSGFLPGTVLPWTFQQRGCSRLSWQPFLIIGKNIGCGDCLSYWKQKGMKGK